MWLQLLEILKYTLPALVVMITAYLVLNSFLKSESRKLDIQLRKETTKETLLLRLQGYERLMIFLERISPPNLMVRFDKEGMTAREFQQLLVAAIRQEFEHNLTNDALKEYIEGLKGESAKIEACHNIIKLCKGIVSKYQKKAVK
jgi:hypothetical protein